MKTVKIKNKLVTMTIMSLLTIPAISNAKLAQKLHQNHPNATKAQIKNAATHPTKGRRAHKLDKSHPNATRDQLKNAVTHSAEARRAHKLEKSYPNATRKQLKNAATHPTKGRRAHKLNQKKGLARTARKAR